MSELRPVPTDPDELRAWIAALDEDDLRTSPHVVSGGLGSQLGLDGGFDRRTARSTSRILRRSRSC